ncbi:unnamed protein product [Camellia sinensis]
MFRDLHRLDFSDFDFDFEAPPPPPSAPRLKMMNLSGNVDVAYKPEEFYVQTRKCEPQTLVQMLLQDENGHIIEHTELTCCPCGDQRRVPSSCGNLFDKMMKGKANTAHCLRFPGDWFHVFGIGQRSVGFSIRIEVKTASKISVQTSLTVNGMLKCATLMEGWRSPFASMISSNNANKPTASHGTATPESNNLPIGQPSSGSAFIKPKGYSASKDIQFTESSVLVRGETPTAAMTKADMEQLAQNRGNAMQRYKEEKKYLRYDKHIRYESSKARADTRKRVKGRFVKASEAPDG